MHNELRNERQASRTGRFSRLALATLFVISSACSDDKKPEATETTVTTQAPTTTEASISTAGPDLFTGGCEPFRLYAQSRWDPLGAAIREEPNVLAEKIGTGDPNEILAADGWISTGDPTYPDNPEPFNNDVWFHLSNREGWVSFAGVRGEVTTPDPMSIDGGMPAPLTPACKGEYGH